MLFSRIDDIYTDSCKLPYWSKMSRDKNQVPCTSFNLRAPATLDALVEEVARIELRTKTAVLTLALTDYVERHHPELFGQYKAVVA